MYYYIEKPEIHFLTESSGKELFGKTFSCTNLFQNINKTSIIFFVNKKKHYLHFVFKNKTTAIIADDSIESKKLKELIESKLAYPSNIRSKTYTSSNIKIEKFNLLIETLKSNSRLLLTLKNNTPINYLVQSSYGDYLYLKYNKEKRILNIQGKPVYIFAEILILMTEWEDFTLEELINKYNSTLQTNLKVKEVREILKTKLPDCYLDLDISIIKMLTPAEVLINADLILDDYSCVILPALKALEGYLKWLFLDEDIIVGKNFWKIFYKGKLTDDIIIKIQNNDFKDISEEIFNYLTLNRGDIVHAEQLDLSKSIVSNKNSAIRIVNEVTHIINESYKKLFKKSE